MSGNEIILLVVVGVTGHLMALFWYSVEEYEVDLSRDRIYDLPIKDPQVRRELKNSVHTPMHAAVLAGATWIGSLENSTIISFMGSLILTAVWAEIWHYISHRVFHITQFHWIHAEHHKSRLSSPFTAISFSFTEKLVFDIGIVGLLMLIDIFVSLNFYGVGMWFVIYLVINSYGHANHEIRSPKFMEMKGKYLTSTVYHALHHSRYTGNYGLGTRFLDRWFGTEWPDSEAVFEKVVVQKNPLTSLREKVEPDERNTTV